MIEARSVRDLLGPSIERGLIKLWERQTGRDSSSLSPDERKALIASKKMELKTMQDEDEERRREYLRRIASEDEPIKDTALDDFIRNSVPPRFSKMRYESLDDEMRRISSLIIQGKSGVVMGAPGTGKTSMAWATAIELRKRKPRTCVTVAPLPSILSGIRSGDDWMNSINRKYGTYDVLFIDEVGKSRSSDSDFELIFSLINFRYEMMRQTVVMGNLESAARVVEALGESAFSRLTGDGGFIVSLGARDDRRRQGAARRFQ